MKHMKQYWLYILSVIFLSACYHEDEIAPTILESVTDKFEFPQGTSPADAIFKRIYDTYGVKVIYKDFTQSDIDRSWQSPNSAFDNIKYQWDYVDEQHILEAAEILDQKVFGLFPEEVIRTAARAYPYIYLVNGLRTVIPGLSESHYPLYPTRALDGITINLELGAAPDNYTYKVYYPMRIATEFFISAYYQMYEKAPLPEIFYTSVGDRKSATYYLSYDLAHSKQPDKNHPDPLNDYWAKQGRIPPFGSYGQIMIGPRTGYQQETAIQPLDGQHKEIPFFFMYLCVDPHWREHFKNEPNRFFAGCDLLEIRLNTFYDYCLDNYGIDFDKVQKRLYAGTTVDTTWVYPDRVYARKSAAGSNPFEVVSKYIYYDFMSN
jgi:hypothetical protein